MLRVRRLLVAVAVCAASVAVPTTANAADGATYVVQDGDSLFGIAIKHKVNVGELLSANQLELTSVIIPGQRLTIPGATTTTGGGSSLPTYTVVAGDTLVGIANRHGVSLGALLRTNDLTVTSLIIPGRQLDLPPGATAPQTPAPQTPATQTGGLTYTVVAGDSLSRIANRHGVALTSLLRANDLTMTSLILPGRKLNLPAGATTPAPTAAAGSSQLQTVIDYAVAQQGKPYVFFTKGPDSFDCSGLVKAAYAKVGRTLVHYSAAQSLQGTPVDFVNEPILPGDLIFMRRHGSASINHVGMAISSTSWIQAAGPGLGVRIGSMPSDSIIAAVRRILPS